MIANRALSRAAAIAAGFGAALVLASCIDTGGPTQTAAAPVSAADQRLRDRVAGHSIYGADATGQPFCTYYAQDGSAMRVVGRGQPQRGSWSISNARVCETLGTVGYCYSFVYQAPTYSTVTVTPLAGSGETPYAGSVFAGNPCVLDAGSTPEEIGLNECIANGPQWCAND